MLLSEEYSGADETIIAKGDVQIQAGDTVVIFALQNAVKKVIKYFQ